jgi:enoyl-CoA hydratase/carnithine racemase
MRKSRVTEEQIIAALKEHAAKELDSALLRSKGSLCYDSCMSTVTLEKRGPAAWIMLRTPAIDAAVVRGLRDAWEAAAGDSDVRAIVLTGEGDIFSSGWDWNAFGGESPPAVVESLRSAGVLDDPFGCFAESARPVIAAINGDALGGGLALALAADIRIAAETARFALPEADIGVLPMAGATQRLLRLTGRGKALEMVLTGEPIDAAEALRVGLASEVTPRPKLEARAQVLAERLAERGPLALQYAKEAISRGIDMPLEQALRYETDLTVILQTTEDRAEGVRAFLEKRKPEFKGR